MTNNTKGHHHHHHHTNGGHHGGGTTILHNSLTSHHQNHYGGGGLIKKNKTFSCCLLIITALVFMLFRGGFDNYLEPRLIESLITMQETTVPPPKESTTATTTTTETKKKKKNKATVAAGAGAGADGDNTNPLSYHIHRDEFLNEMVDCIVDGETYGNCHIYFLHFGKTAGTTIENVFENYIFQQPRIEHPCCWEDAVTRFQNSSVEHCLERKFFSFQVHPTQFSRILKTCQSILHEENTKKKESNERQKQHRVIVLTSIREPVARRLSDIHQICNKRGNIKRSDNATLAACQRCDYNAPEDQEFWFKFIHSDNTFWKNLYSFVKGDMQLQSIVPTEKSEKGKSNKKTRRMTTFSATPPNVSVQYAVLDTIDTTEMFESLKKKLPTEELRSRIPSTRSSSSSSTPSSSTSANATATSSASSSNNTSTVNANTTATNATSVINSNPEKKHVCSFGMSSELIKGLGPSASIYRNMTLGRY